MSEPDQTSQDHAALKARLEALGRNLDSGGTRDPQPSAMEKAGAGIGPAFSLGVRVMSEFVAGVAVGAFISWELDHWLGTSPLLLILFIALGTAAGFWSVYRVAAKPGSR